jgi:hypothetical protein
VSCGSFVERNIGDVNMFFELWNFEEGNIGDVKICELWEFCGEKYG